MDDAHLHAARCVPGDGNGTHVVGLGFRAANLPVMWLEELNGVVVSVRLDVLRKRDHDGAGFDRIREDAECLRKCRE